MYSYAHYPSPQTNFYNTSAPYTAGPYTTQYASHYATSPSSRPSPRGHARTASYGQAPPRSAPLRPPPMYAYPGSPASPYQSPDYLSDEHVSYSARRPPPIPRFRTSAGPTRMREKTVPSYSPQHGSRHEYSYQIHEDRSSPFRSQVPRRDSQEDTPTRPRTKSTPHTTRQAPPKSPKPTKAKPATVREVTDADRKAHDIPKGYSTKNWNPDEEPILLLGSVFDANSLGRWIYDWAAFAHNPHTAIPQMAADLWLLLIQTSGKMKMAREAMSKIRKDSNREMVDDFLDSGERIMDERLVKIVKKSEEYMLRKAKKAGSDKSGKVTLGKDSGVEFVDCMFGRDRELINSEKLINSLHVWNKRYDANCEDIVKNPSQ